MVKDLTKGSPTRLILSFSLPLMLGVLFQQFYSFMDTAIVGNVLGLDALAAVGCTGSLNFLILGFCMGVCSGFSIPIAQSFGAGDLPRLRRYVINGAFLSVVISLVMAILTVVFCREMLVLMQTPPNILDDAYNYIVVIFAFIPVTISYNYLSAVIRALGDSRTPVVFLVIASVINIALDYLFMMGLHWGVMGAALATGISQMVAGALCLWHVICHVDMLTFHREDLRVEPAHMRVLMGQGVPMGLQFSITAVGSVILTASVNTLGSVAVGAVTAGSKLSMFFCSGFDALASTIATYGGQNRGAGRIDRIRKGLRSCSVIGLIYCLIALVIVMQFGRSLIGLFIAPTQVQASEQAYRFLLTLVEFYVPLLFVNILRLLIQGVGKTSIAMFAGVAEMIARIIVAFWLVPQMGFIAACYASPLAWILANLFLFPATFVVLNHLEKQVKAEAVSGQTP